MRGRTRFGLIACGAILLALTGIGLHLQQQNHIGWFVAVASAQGAVYLIAVRITRPLASRRTVIVILGVAAALRLVVVFTPPYLSTDIYRYVWDGRVIAAGINPYRYIPTDPHLAGLRDRKIFPNINRNNYARTIYPPGAEAIFWVVTRVSESLVAMKAAMVAFEAVAILLLLRLLQREGWSPPRILVYAWHPLPLWEFAGGGHIDAAIVALLALALWSRRRCDGGWLTGLALAGGTLVKLYPAALLPALWRRWDWRLPVIFAAAIVVAYAPFLGVGWRVLGFLPQYLSEEGFAGGGAGVGFYLWSVARTALPLAGISDLTYVGVAAGSLAVLTAFVAFGRERPIEGAALIAAAFMLLLSPHYPWYFAWLIVFACLVPSLSLPWLTVASFVLYLAPVGSQLVWDRRRFLVESVLYAPFLALAAADLWRRRRQEQPGHGDNAK